MTTNYTPGPWHFESDGEPVDHRTFESPGYFDNLYLIGSNGVAVAGCDEYHVLGNVHDRCLIAAAPEMLEALKGLVAAHNGDLNEITFTAKLHAWDAAHAAIAKAEGR